MDFGITYDDEPEYATHYTCCRCGLPTEYSPVGSGDVPTGPDGALEHIRNIVLCLDCLRLLREDASRFWYSGWRSQRRKK